MDDKKKRLLIILLFGVAVIVAALFLTESDVKAPPVAQGPPPVVQTTQPVAQMPSSSPPAVAQLTPLPGSPNTAPGSANPAMPLGASSAAKPMRDVFSPPAGYASLLSGPNSSVAQGGNGKAAAAAMQPMLTGVIEGDGRRVVLLRQGAISRSYRVGESAGSYQVVAIGNNSATLEGPNGTIILRMGQ